VNLQLPVTLAAFDRMMAFIRYAEAFQKAFPGVLAMRPRWIAKRYAWSRN
jgi:hypothetical protein